MTHAKWVFDTTYEYDAMDVAGEAWDSAFSAAIDSAVHRAHQGFVIGVREDIIEKAVDLDADPDNDMNEDGVASLLWYAKLLDETLPEELRLP